MKCRQNWAGGYSAVEGVEKVSFLPDSPTEPRLAVLPGQRLNKVVTAVLFWAHYHLSAAERARGALSVKQDVLVSGPISPGLSFVSVWGRGGKSLKQMWAGSKVSTTSFFFSFFESLSISFPCRMIRLFSFPLLYHETCQFIRIADKLQCGGCMCVCYCVFLVRGGGSGSESELWDGALVSFFSFLFLLHSLPLFMPWEGKHSSSLLLFFIW